MLHLEPFANTERHMSMRRQHPPLTIRSFRRFSAVACTAGLLAFVAACGDDESSSETTVAATDQITFAGQWARSSPMMVSACAAYVTITSPVDDKLIAAKVEANVAATVEVHETVMADTPSDTTMMAGTDTTMNGGGEMTMRPVEFIELPAGVAVELKPGGYHIMLLDLVKPLEVGSTIKLTLVFESAGEITIDVPVRDEAP